MGLFSEGMKELAPREQLIFFIIARGAKDPLFWYIINPLLSVWRCSIWNLFYSRSDIWCDLFLRRTRTDHVSGMSICLFVKWSLYFDTTWGLNNVQGRCSFQIFPECVCSGENGRLPETELGGSHRIGQRAPVQPDELLHGSPEERQQKGVVSTVE